MTLTRRLVDTIPIARERSGARDRAARTSYASGRSAGAPIATPKYEHATPLPVGFSWASSDVVAMRIAALWRWWPRARRTHEAGAAVGVNPDGVAMEGARG